MAARALWFRKWAATLLALAPAAAILVSGVLEGDTFSLRTTDRSSFVRLAFVLVGGLGLLRKSVQQNQGAFLDPLLDVEALCKPVSLQAWRDVRLPVRPRSGSAYRLAGTGIGQREAASPPLATRADPLVGRTKAGGRHGA